MAPLCFFGIVLLLVQFIEKGRSGYVMSRRVVTLLLVCTMYVISVISPGYAVEDEWAPIAKRYESTIVDIDGSVRYGDGETSSWRASGFFIADDLVLTNAHVALDDDELLLKSEDVFEWMKSLKSREYRFRVGFKGQYFNAVAYATNPLNDTAILKLDRAPSGVVPAVFGDSDGVQVGDGVIAIGRPLGYSYSVTKGVVSAVHRRNQIELFTIEDYIQTDAAVNPGNSGGVLLNNKGEVIGVVNVSDRRGQGLHFAISSNLVKRFLPRMLNGEHIRCGISGITVFLGEYTSSNGIEALVSLSKLTGVEDMGVLKALQETLVRPGFQGALVTGVNQLSANLNLHRGDIITEFNGEQVTNGFELKERLLEVRPDEEYSITVVRFEPNGDVAKIRTFKQSLRIESRGSYFLRLLKRM